MLREISIRYESTPIGSNIYQPCLSFLTEEHLKFTNFGSPILLCPQVVHCLQIHCSRVKIVLTYTNSNIEKVKPKFTCKLKFKE